MPAIMAGMSPEPTQSRGAAVRRRWRNLREDLASRLSPLRDSLPAEAMRRFVEIDLLTHAASLSFYTMLSLAPLLVLVLWLTASLYPAAQDALMEQIGAVAGDNARQVARTVIKNAQYQPDIGSLAGWWSTLLLFVGATAVFARLQATLNRILLSSAHRLKLNRV